MDLFKVFTKPLSAAFKNKARLWLEYALIAAVVVMLGLLLSARIKQHATETRVAVLEGQLDGAKLRLQMVEAVNVSQQEALETIQRIREVDSHMLTGLETDMQTLRVRDRSVTAKLAELERSNEAVRRYLDASLPAVGCVLDNSCAAGARPHRGEGADPAVQPDKPVPRPAAGARADGT